MKSVHRGDGLFPESLLQILPWYPGFHRTAAPVFCVSLRYLPLEENLWQIVLTVGMVPPGARNIPSLAKADAAV
ncbi:unnamed protein product [Lasius platythorax]|uniref:Uncharacterized protein n=1 Tax=Lasius platythorax TaxID=488582 RepID=A0AAV2P8K2_9HYME